MGTAQHILSPAEEGVFEQSGTRGRYPSPAAPGPARRAHPVGPLTLRLVLLSGSLAGRTRTLARGQEIILGRDPRVADVVFGVEDRLVSRRHASLQLGDDGLVLLRDLRSSTGTFVDGQSVEEAELGAGDVFELGRGGPRLRIEDAGGETLVAPYDTRADASPPSGDSAEPAAPLPEGAQLRLEIAAGPRQGEALSAGGRVVRLGRGPGNTFAFAAEPMVSAQHAKIVRLDDGFVLVDLESRNGTFLNGRPVQRARLRDGDRVSLGTGGPELAVAIAVDAGPAATVLIPGFAEIARRRGPATLLAERDLPPEGLVAGRGPNAGLRLDSPIVSQAHARLWAEGTHVVVQDLGSTNGTFVNGERTERRRLAAGDHVVVGPFRLEARGNRIAVYDTRRRAAVHASGLTVLADGRRLLDGVRLDLVPGSFTAIIGPSGSGKSTLLKALCAARPADAGDVRVNGASLYAAPGALAGMIGYVPQDDIVHGELTPEECLLYTARLRLPGDTRAEERSRRIADVLATLELTERRDVPIHRLSGGQRKRVSIAVELLTEPDLLFLDEPTSGLDPGLEESLMLLLRELSFKGKTVVIVTHTLDHLALCDALVVLSAGRIAFEGAPSDALRRFGLSHPSQLYARLKERPAEDWTRGARAAAEGADTPPFPALARRAAGPGLVAQLGVLARRYVTTLTRDTRNAGLLLLQAPLVAALIGLSMLYGAADGAATKPKNTLLFLLALTSVWFGCSNAARELVKERALYLRERMAGLRAFPYVTSKVAVLAVFGLLQCLASLAVLHLWFGVPGRLPALLTAMWLASLVGTLLGLLISAIARTADRAMTLLPIVLIPQVLFTFPSVQLDMKGPAGVVALAMPTWWSFDLLRRIALEPDEGVSDDDLDGRLSRGDGALLTRKRFETMLQAGYPMWSYRSTVEITWTASAAERWAARLPGGLGRRRAAAVDATALLALGAALYAVVVGTESRRRPR